MNRKSAHSGISLIELMIVIGVMVILMAIAVPAVKGIIASFDDSAGARPLINAALSAARAIAIREQTYAGIRFQEDTAGNTYLTFIVHDFDGTKLENGFRAVIGRSPMKLPENTGVLVNAFSFNPLLTDAQNEAKNNALIDTTPELTDCSTFSVVFSPAGKLTVHPVRIRNMKGYIDSNGNTANNNDMIFNIQSLVDAGMAMFYQDDYPNPDVPGSTDLGLDEEDSQREFILYEKKEFKAVFPTQRYSNVFMGMRTERISSYTGELVVEYREQK